MLLIFSILLLFSVGRFVDGLMFETKTVGVGDASSLTCPRKETDQTTYLFWTRFVSGSLPEVLGATYLFNENYVKNNIHFTTRNEPGSFVLQIHQTQRSDIGFYYCVGVFQTEMTFVKGAFLTIKDALGTDPDISAVLQVPPSESARSVTLQCSVPSNSQSKTCPGEHSVYWFKVGSKESHPRLVYTHGNSNNECEHSPEGPASGNCVYNLSKIIHSADAGTYSCAVVKCGTMMFGNLTQLEHQDVSGSSPFTPKAVIYVLFGFLAINMIVVSILIYTTKINKCDSCKGSATLQRNNFSLEIQQRDKDTHCYSAVIFTMIRTNKDTVKDPQSAERRRIYRAAKSFGLD